MQTHVGYVNHTVKADNFALISVGFESTSGSDLTIGQFIQGDIATVPADFLDLEHMDTANRVDVYIGNNKYLSRYYVENGWDPDANDGDGDYYTGWVNDDGYREDLTVAPGDAIWFLARTGDVTFTTPGQVYTEGSTIEVDDGQFQMFGYDKPIQIDLNDANVIGYENLVAVPADFLDLEHMDTANRIDVYIGNNKYLSYYYLENGWDPDANDGDGEYYTGWCNDDGYKVDAIVPVSVGMWAKGTAGAFTIKCK